MRRLILLAALAIGACEDRSYRDIGAQVQVLAKRTDGLVPRATEALTRFGRRAVPQIETAMHTASPRGRQNLVAVLDRIGEPETAAVLRHFAVYDPDPSVRAVCEEVLRRWAAATDARGPAAKAALARVAEKRARGEGPLADGDQR